MNRNVLISISLSLWMTGCYKLKNDVYPSTNQPPAFPAKEWTKVNDPEALGWSASKLEESRKYAEDIKSKSVMVIDGGRLIAAWGETSQVYYVASIRKSYLSVLYDFAVNDRISPSATLADYGITDKNPPLNDRELRATVRDLLTSSSGVYHHSAASDNNDLPARNSSTPGDTFYYNNWDFNALGTIFNKRTGTNLFDIFNQRVAAPIGMQDFNWQQNGRYDYSDVSEHPAYHFDMTTRDMARFGLLLMNSGNWNGQQLISPTWIQESTSARIAVPESYGGGSYGYMWWVHDGGTLSTIGLSKKAYSAQGNWSQLILIDPEKRLVIVHRGYKKNIEPQKLLTLLQKIIAAKK